MYLFVLYAAAVWFGVFFFRRKWPALVVLLVTIPVALAGVHAIRYALGTGNTILNIVATAYEALILMVGVIIALSPRRRSATIPCPRCRYDLTGITGGTCPECGRLHGLDHRLRHGPHRHRARPAERRDVTPSLPE